MRPKGVADGHAVNIPQLLQYDQDRCGDASRKFLCAMVSKGSEVRLGRGNPPGRMPGKSAKES